MVGQQIGKYRVTQQIGRGGMGTVYCAVDETLHRDVAIKVLNAGLNDPTVGRRFRAEAVTVARLNHPGIATIYELVQHEGQWLMVMEFVRGETLEKIVAERGPVPVVRAAELTMQMLAALAHAHGLGVVHRDLKPANLMLTAGGGVKVMDFGIARVAGAEQLTTAGFMMGTPAYMAPEQVMGGDIDARTDLYAAGLIFYQLVTGLLPFKGDTPFLLAQARVQQVPTPVRTQRPDLPEWVGQVIDISLSRDPLRRFQTAMLFREAIRRGLANLPIEVPSPAVMPPELVATAAPGSMRIEAETARAPKPTPPPPAELPTMATAVPVDLSHLRPGAADRIEKSGPSRTTIMAVAAAVVTVAAIGAWFALRGPDNAQAGPAESDPAAVATLPPLADPAAVAPAPAAPIVTAPPAATAAPPPAGRAAAPPASAIQPASSTTTSATTTPAATSPTGAAPAAAPGATPGRAGAPAPATAGRAAGAAAAPVAITGVRGFVVTGRRIDERDAVLNFADGQVVLADQNSRATISTLPFAQITSAAHTRGRNPRWYPTLAGPPADAELPGGLFRGDRHWLALQSRSGFIIVRVNDNDWRRVAQTVTEQLGLTVAELAQ